MSRIRLFESRKLAEADRLAGLSLEMVTPLRRHGRWRRALPHVEPLPVLIWIQRGQGRITVLGRTRGFAPATCITVPPGTPFSIEPGTITEGTLLRLPDLFEAPLPASPRHLRLSDINAQAELAGLLDNLSRHGDLTDAPSARAALGRLILISALVERIATADAAPAPDAPARLAARYARAVEEHLSAAVTLDILGRDLGVTPTHLTRTMQTTCAMSAQQYLHARLMHEARSRLADTESPIGDIAAAMGYSSAAYFSRAFARSAGESPSSFRNTARGVAA